MGNVTDCFDGFALGFRVCAFIFLSLPMCV